MLFKPASMPQGGVAIVYLNESATAATARFQGRQYPMLNDTNRWWAIIGVGAFIEPGLHPVSITYTPAGRTSQASIVQSIAITDVVYPVEHIELDDATAALLSPEIVQAELAQRAAIFGGFSVQRLWQGPFRAPARGSQSSQFGEGRSYNGAPVTDYHRGTDFIGDIGSPVFASATGRVAFTGELKVRGNAIMLDHGAGVFTAYHHLSQILVEEGQLVNIGDNIGAIGSTGLVTGPHLHWEVIVRGVEVDGAYWLSGEELGP
jgi:murein DD-endopeptidase MepM/ murein hydrolase activator NlpD